MKDNDNLRLDEEELQMEITHKAQPLVTVFIPVYNCEKYIKDALDSIINQTYRNIEILIIDDGSVDNTIDIIKKYNDNRIRLLKNNVNKGIPYTRNRGIQESKGKYIAVMDADDISDIKRIEKQIKVLENNNDIDVVASYFDIFYDQNKLNKTNVKKNIYKVLKKIKYKILDNLSSEDIRISLLFRCVIANPTAMIRVSTLKKYNIYYNEDCFVAQDYQMWCEISKIGKFYMIPETLLDYRFGHENITKKSKIKKRDIRKKVIDDIHNEMINFYGFNLMPVELNIFNNFFKEDNIYGLSNEELENISNLLFKLVKENESKNIFNKKKFKRVLSKSILRKIDVNSLKLNQKIKLYNSICDKNDYRRFIRACKLIIIEQKYIFKKQSYN